MATLVLVDGFSFFLTDFVLFLPTSPLPSDVAHHAARVPMEGRQIHDANDHQWCDVEYYSGDCPGRDSRWSGVGLRPPDAFPELFLLC